MYITIPENLIASMIQAAQNIPVNSLGGALFGRVLDAGDVAQILAMGDFNTAGSIGVWGYVEDIARIPDLFSARLFPDCVVAVVQPQNQVSFWVYDVGTLFPVRHEVVRLYADFYSRLAGLFDTTYLSDKTVTVIGLGTGGGMAALELAKTGVGHFRLVDYDRLEVHNIARHVCGLHDLGRYKTRAVADLLRDTHPTIQVKTFEFDILEDRDLLANVIAGSDLVIGATDSEASKRLINQICWSLEVPAVYGAAYDRAFGGDVVRIIPPETPCYECFYAQVVELFETSPKKGNLDYSSADLSKVVAEPGLGMDVGFITLVLTKMALLTLLRGTESTLEDFPTDWIMWGNRAVWAFQKPLESIFLEFERNPQCSVCQTLAVKREQAMQMLGMTENEYQQALERLAEDLNNIPVFSANDILRCGCHQSDRIETITNEE